MCTHIHSTLQAHKHAHISRSLKHQQGLFLPSTLPGSLEYQHSPSVYLAPSLDPDHRPITHFTGTLLAGWPSLKLTLHTRPSSTPYLQVPLGIPALNLCPCSGPKASATCCLVQLKVWWWIHVHTQPTPGWGRYRHLHPLAAVTRCTGCDPWPHSSCQHSPHVSLPQKLFFLEHAPLLMVVIGAWLEDAACSRSWCWKYTYAQDREWEYMEK